MQTVMQTVQLSIADGSYEAAVREALARTCAWRLESVERPDPLQNCGLVLDEAAFERVLLPLSNPERVVLIARRGSAGLAKAGDAGVVSGGPQSGPIGTGVAASMAGGPRFPQ